MGWALVQELDLIRSITWTVWAGAAGGDGLGEAFIQPWMDTSGHDDDDKPPSPPTSPLKSHPAVDTS